MLLHAHAVARQRWLLRMHVGIAHACGDRLRQRSLPFAC
jgi:hypothetical protein